jgi:hypothetical protein
MNTKRILIGAAIALGLLAATPQAQNGTRFILTHVGTAGAALAVGAGNSSTGTPRVVIASNQAAIPASQSGTWNITNISGTVSLPTGAATSANQTTIIGHLDGVEGFVDGLEGVLGATGDSAATAGGTGSLSAKLRIMSGDIDAIKTAVQTLDNAISGSGFNISQIGGTAVGASGCEDQTKVASANINTSSSGNTQLVALNGSEVVYVCGYTLMAAGDVVVQFIRGTGTACATGETDLETLTFDDVAGHAITNANGGAAQFKGNAGDALCVELSGAVGVTGRVTYVRQ